MAKIRGLADRTEGFGELRGVHAATHRSIGLTATFTAHATAGIRYNLARLLAGLDGVGSAIRNE